MKLSMWILADWLKEYNTRLEIQEGNATIEGIRFLSGRLRDFSPDQVYIGRAADMFDDLGYRDTIVLAHEHDLIFIDDANTDDIINEVLAAIDYYNKWELQLWEAATHDDGLQGMLNLSDEIFDNPSRVVDMQGHILAISRKFGPDDYNQRWKDMYDTGIVQLSNVSLNVVTADGKELNEWLEVPDIYFVNEDGKRQDYIAAGIWLDEEIVAALLIMEYKTPLSIAHCQLAAVFSNVLKKTLANQNQSPLLQSKTSILENLLLGRSLSKDMLAGLGTLGLEVPMSLLVLHCNRENVPIIRNGSMLSLIRKSPARNISLIFEDHIVTVTAESTLHEHLKHILTVINTHHYAIGISLPFYDWNEFPAPHKQACFSYEMGKNNSGIYYCRDYAYEYLISAVCQMNADYCFLHPALRKLNQYDKEHGTDFCGTLYQYLSSDRNIAQTCKELYIHRNTLLYRIKRIEQLIECDLNNLDERIFLLLSYKMQELNGL